MKVINLKKLELTNYRNIEHQIMEFDGNSKIVGENRIGKTNTLEAIYFLLTDKLLNGGTDIPSIKPLNDTSKVVRVDGTFELVDGESTKTITIAKEYKEEWTKTRGSNEMVLKGHSTTYYYNGVKQGTQKEFNNLVAIDFEIPLCKSKIDIMRLLVDPLYVGELGESDQWKELRTFIIDLVGDVADSDVFKANPSLKAIESDLNACAGRVDQLKLRYKNEITGLKECIIGYDANIELLEKTNKPSDAEIAVAKKGIEDCEVRIRDLQGNKAKDNSLIFIDSQINSCVSQINDIRENLQRNDPMKEKRKQLFEEYEELKNLVNIRSSITVDIVSLNSKKDANENNIQKCRANREEYIKRLQTLDSYIKNPTSQIDLVCPTCHRPLEPNECERIQNDAIEGWKKERESILEEGRLNKKNLESYQLELQEFQKEEEKLNKKADELDKLIEEKKKVTDILDKEIDNYISVPEDPRIVELQTQKQKLEESKKKIQSENEVQDLEINTFISEEETKKQTFQKVIDDLAYYNRQMGVLEDTRKKRDHATVSLADREQFVEMINAFIRCKLEMLDSNVKSVFGEIKFQLLKQNINGGFEPICKAYIYDPIAKQSTNVNWKSGSKSEKVITGVAICECVKAKLGLPDMPFLFDEGGEISSDSFNTRFNTNSQLICVKVQDGVYKPIVLKI